jgi:hypothetical protein
MNSIPKVEIKFDKRYPSKPGKVPLVLYIYFEGKKKLYLLNWKEDGFILDYWDNKKRKDGDIHTAEWNRFKEKQKKVEDRIKAVIASRPVFSINGFIEAWKAPDPKDIATLKGAFETHIEHLKKEDRIGTAISYQ